MTLFAVGECHLLPLREPREVATALTGVVFVEWRSASDGATAEALSAESCPVPLPLPVLFGSEPEGEASSGDLVGAGLQCDIRAPFNAGRNELRRTKLKLVGISPYGFSFELGKVKVFGGAATGELAFGGDQ